MSRFQCVFALLLLAGSAGLARADGMFYQLPKDGASATYELNASFKNDNPAPLSLKGTMRIASVGQVTEKKQPCRWIEVHFDMDIAVDDVPQGKTTEVYKLLIPEKYLAKGQSPLDHVVRAWKQKDDGETQELKHPAALDEGPLPIVLSKPWKDAKPLEKTVVESKLGKLPCEGVAGALEWKLRNGKVAKCKYENRTSAKSPFGVVASRWTIEAPQWGDGVVLEAALKLADLGEKAKSELPDVK
jgi:hypothetical protein